jgi:hypothetical protein
MELVLLVGVGVAAALAAGESARRALLGRRMDRSFEVLKVSTPHGALGGDAAMRRVRVRRMISIKAGRHDHGSLANPQESLGELTSAPAPHIPLHARQAS